MRSRWVAEKERWPKASKKRLLSDYNAVEKGQGCEEAGPDQQRQVMDGIAIYGDHQDGQRSGREWRGIF